MQASGMQANLMQKLLREGNPQGVLVEALLITSQVARMAKPEAHGATNTYDIIHRAQMYGAVRQLLPHSDAPVRARLIGASPPRSRLAQRCRALYQRRQNRIGMPQTPADSPGTALLDIAVPGNGRCQITPFTDATGTCDPGVRRCVLLVLLVNSPVPWVGHLAESLFRLYDPGEGCVLPTVTPPLVLEAGALIPLMPVRC